MTKQRTAAEVPGGTPVDLPVRPLVEKMREMAAQAGHYGAWSGGVLLDQGADEIERLTTALNHANDQAERFERGWYMRGDSLEKLQRWADAYPLTVFPEPDFAKAHELLQAGGMTLDAISASNMRHVINGVRKLVDEGLKA